MAFAHNPAFSHDKFAAKAVPYLFLGYPSSKKGYKLLDLSTNKPFVSRDVQFHKTIFPYSSDSLSQYMKSLPVSIDTIQPFKPVVDDMEFTEELEI